MDRECEQQPREAYREDSEQDSESSDFSHEPSQHEDPDSADYEESDDSSYDSWYEEEESSVDTKDDSLRLKCKIHNKRVDARLGQWQVGCCLGHGGDGDYHGAGVPQAAAQSEMIARARQQWACLFTCIAKKQQCRLRSSEMAS